MDRTGRGSKANRPDFFSEELGLQKQKKLILVKGIPTNIKSE